MKNSKVVNVQSNGTWKELYKFEVELDNGDIGALYRKSNDSKLTKGQDISYTINDKGTLKIVTDYQKNQSQSSPKQDVDKNNSIARAVAFKGAVEFDNQCTPEVVLKNAKYFYDNWLCDNYDVQKKVDKVAKAFNDKFAGTTPDDLPF
mgnify:CR=1 FL=1|jgi:primosomal protein N'